MNTTLNVRKVLPIFLGCLLIAMVPSFFFCYLVALFFLVNVFLVICIIDFIKKTQMRKDAGIILDSMFVAAIVALGIHYLTSSLV